MVWAPEEVKELKVEESKERERFHAETQRAQRKKRTVENQGRYGKEWRREVAATQEGFLGCRGPKKEKPRPESGRSFLQS
jgi:hypothetical protein